MEKYQKLFELIESADVITIFGHACPDGDCYGSQIGLKMALLENYPNKKIYAIGGGFSRIPEDFPSFDEVEDELIRSSLAIIVDLSNGARINDQRAFTAKSRIKIDHHIFTEVFTDLEIIEEDKVACAQIITNIIQWKFNSIPLKAAEPLFLGIVTDSGRFMYPPVNESLFITVAHLLKSGVDAKKIYDRLYEVEAESLRFKAFVYQNFTIKDGVSYLAFTKEMREKLGVSKDSAASQVNLIASIKGCFAWVFFSEGDDGLVRVELRSGGFPVQPIAVSFGGGGHRCASGCVLKDIKDHILVIEKLIAEHGRED